MTTFTTRVKRAEAAFHIATAATNRRITRSYNIIDSSPYTRIVKKHQDYVDANGILNVWLGKEVEAIDFTADDVVVKNQLWTLQQRCIKQARRLGCPLRNAGGLLGLYRYILEDITLKATRENLGFK